MNIKIVTWNMDYWKNKKLNKDIWDYFLNNIDADIYLFQESNPPEHIKKDSNLIWNKIDKNRNWGSGIYSKKYNLSQETINTKFNGSLTIANTVINNKKLTFISLYGLMTDGYSIPNLHSMLSDLSPLFYGKLNGKRNIILGGDLNASIQFDLIYKYNNSHKIFFDRLKDFNFFDAFDLTDKEYPVQTLRHKKSKVNWQNDYFFMNKPIFKNIISCKVLENDEIRRFSDHNPVLIEIKV